MDKFKIPLILTSSCVFGSGMVLIKAISKSEPNMLQIAMATVGFSGFLILLFTVLKRMKKVS